MPKRDNTLNPSELNTWKKRPSHKKIAANPPVALEKIEAPQPSFSPPYTYGPFSLFSCERDANEARGMKRANEDSAYPDAKRQKIDGSESECDELLPGIVGFWR